MSPTSNSQHYCAVDHYSATGNVPCLPCPTGSFTNDMIGSTSCGCKTGYFGFSGEAPCSKCPHNYFSKPGDHYCFNCIGYECTPDFDINNYLVPSKRPTRAPSMPTYVPSIGSSASPTEFPSELSSAYPTESPTKFPSQKPSDVPSSNHSVIPTVEPTFFPTGKSNQ